VQTQSPWPTTAEALVAEQLRLVGERPPFWRPPAGPLALGGCWVVFSRGTEGVGEVGEPAWAAAALRRPARPTAVAVLTSAAGAPYEPGLLALREGPLLEAAVRTLPVPPDVLLVNATGRDHPRHAGLALHLGAVLRVPTVGVTHRPLLAAGDWPEDERGATSPFRVGGEVLGYWHRTSAGVRPLAVHAAWRTDAATALEVVRGALGATPDARTPEPLRLARQAARQARARAASTSA
jgi:deoxyribonuclease V